MATSSEAARNKEQFYQSVRQRTADSWRKQYVTPRKQTDEDLVKRFRSKPESAYSASNVIWLLVSIGIFYLTDFALVLVYDPRIDRTWFNCALGSLAVSTLCCFYCVIWLSWIKGVHSDKWEDHNVFVIPVATIAGLIGGVLICYSVWPVWGVLTFPIVGSQFMGFIVVVAMIPAIF